MRLPKKSQEGKREERAHIEGPEGALAIGGRASGVQSRHRQGEGVLRVSEAESTLAGPRSVAGSLALFLVDEFEGLRPRARAVLSQLDDQAAVCVERPDLR